MNDHPCHPQTAAPQLSLQLNFQHVTCGGVREAWPGHKLLRREQERGLGLLEVGLQGPKGDRERVGCTDRPSTPPANCPGFLGRRKANRHPTSGSTATSEAGLGPVTIWVGSQPQVQQEGVALAQQLHLLTLTQRGPSTVLGTQRGLRCCQAGTHTHREKHAIRGRGSSRGASQGQRLTRLEAVNSLLTTY